MVTRPFGFEGRRRSVQAEQGIQDLKQAVDTLIIIPNDRLLEVAEPSTTVVEAFQLADEVLTSGVAGITGIITTPGLINVDFADVKAVMQGAGSAVMGIGRSTGEQRAQQAADKAISSPLLETSMEGATGVLMSVAGPTDLTLLEVNQAAGAIAEHCDPDANVIFGAVIDDAFDDEVRVTVIAAGFEAGRPSRLWSYEDLEEEPGFAPGREDDLDIPSFVEG